MSSATLPVVEGDAALAETGLAELPLVKRRLRIDTIGHLAIFPLAAGVWSRPSWIAFHDRMLRSRPQCPSRSSNALLARHSHRAGRSVSPPQNRREARAALFTHQLGWEVRLVVGSQLEVVQTQVSRDQEEVLAAGERWKNAMIEKEWH